MADDEAPAPAAPAVPHHSPDGMWMWNGTQWVPAAPVHHQAGTAWRPPRRRRNPWLMAAAGCGIVALIGIVALVVFVVNVLNNAPLHSFPVYPGASSSSIHLSSTNGNTVDRRIWTASGSVDTIRAWYSEHLTGEWVVDSRGDFSTSSWTFHHTTDPPGTGTITFLSDGGQTTIQVDFHY